MESMRNNRETRKDSRSGSDGKMSMCQELAFSLYLTLIHGHDVTFAWVFSLVVGCHAGI